MQRAVGVFDLQRAPCADTADHARETGSVGQPEGLRSVDPVHAAAILLCKRHPVARFERGIPSHECGVEPVEHLFSVERASRFERHRGGIGQCGIELRLVDVDADAGHRAGEPPACEVMLNEDTHQFAIAGVDVVRPFDAGIDSAGAEGVDQRERHGLREQELLACGKERRTEHDRKEKVHPFGTRPCMSPLPASRRLPFGADHVAVAVTFFTREVVGRSRLRNMIDHGEIENLSVRSSARPKRCMPPFTPQRRNRAARR